MDLVATLRKEGSRGGRGDFKWSDVQTAANRENYLGHSIHAPVGRFNQGKDLSWYTRDNKVKDSQQSEDPTAAAARQRAEEIKRIKEAEEDALARALGLPVAPRTNANTEPLGDRREVDKILKESTEDHAGSSGLGFGHSSRQPQGRSSDVERLEGNADQQDKELAYAMNEYRRRHGQGLGHGHGRERRRDRGHSRSRSRDGDRYSRSHRSHDKEHRHRRRSTSKDRQRHHKHRLRSSSNDNRDSHPRHREARRHHRSRSRSPRRSRDQRPPKD